jgi:hypothetical protein
MADLLDSGLAREAREISFKRYRRDAHRVFVIKKDFQDVVFEFLKVNGVGRRGFWDMIFVDTTVYVSDAAFAFLNKLAKKAGYNKQWYEWADEKVTEIP